MNHVNTDLINQDIIITSDDEIDIQSNTTTNDNKSLRKNNVSKQKDRKSISKTILEQNRTRTKTIDDYTNLYGFTDSDERNQCLNKILEVQTNNNIDNINTISDEISHDENYETDECDEIPFSDKDLSSIFTDVINTELETQYTNNELDKIQQNNYLEDNNTKELVSIPINQNVLDNTQTITALDTIQCNETVLDNTRKTTKNNELEILQKNNDLLDNRQFNLDKSTNNNNELETIQQENNILENIYQEELATFHKNNYVTKNKKNKTNRNLQNPVRRSKRVKFQLNKNNNINHALNAISKRIRNSILQNSNINSILREAINYDTPSDSSSDNIDDTSNTNYFIQDNNTISNVNNDLEDILNKTCCSKTNKQ